MTRSSARVLAVHGDHLKSVSQLGERRLQWAPIASGLSPAHDLGFTVGAWGVASHASGNWTTTARGGYLTVWRRGEDGAWRVLFDAGDVLDQAAP